MFNIENTVYVQFIWEHIFPGNKKRTVYVTVDITKEDPKILAARYTNGMLLKCNDFQDLEESIIQHLDIATEGKEAWLGFFNEFCDEVVIVVNLP